MLWSPAVFHLQQQSFPAAGTGLLILLLGWMNPLHPPLLLFSVVFFLLFFLQPIVFKAPVIFFENIRLAVLSHCGLRATTQARYSIFEREIYLIVHPAFLILTEFVVPFILRL